MNETPPAIVKTATRTLKELAKAIQSALKKHEESTAELGAAFMEVKAQLKHGEWTPWIEKYTGYSPRRIREIIQEFKTAVSAVLDDGEQESKCAIFAHLKSEETDAKQDKETPSEETPVSGNAVLLCRSCRTTGAKPACKLCKELNKPEKEKPKAERKKEREPGDDTDNDKPGDVDGHGRKQKRERKPAEPRSEVKDCNGEVVPESCRDLFADETLSDLIMELEQVESVLKADALAKRAASLTKHYGFILIDKFTEHVYEASHRVQVGLEALKSGEPYAVCPKCSGEGCNGDGKPCKACRGYRYVPEHKYAELTNG